MISGRNTANWRELRELFPEVPMMALTATATERVRQDIVAQLKLREPGCYVASFNRPNLTYRVMAKVRSLTSRCWSFVRARPRESGIVYCQARKTTESLAGQADGGRRQGEAVSRRVDARRSARSTRSCFCGTRCG